MANTNRTNPHGSSPVSLRRSARNKSGDAPPRSTAARASKKKKTQTKKRQETSPPDSGDDADHVQGQRKDPPELLPGAVLNSGSHLTSADAFLPPNARPPLPPVGAFLYAINNRASDTGTSVPFPSSEVMPRLIEIAPPSGGAAAALAPDNEHQRYPRRSNRTPAPSPPKKITIRRQDADAMGNLSMGNLSPIHHDTPPPAKESLLTDMAAYASHAALESIGDDDSEYQQDESDEKSDDEYRPPTLPPLNKMDVLAMKLFEYSDDDDDDRFIYDDELNEDARRIEESASRKKVQVGRSKRLLLMNGPEEPDYHGMSVAEAQLAKETFELERKRWREGRLLEKLRKKKSEEFNVGDYSGDLSPILRTIAQVSASHLKRGHTFPDRDLVLLRVAEEANFRGIHYTVVKADDRQVTCIGTTAFNVHASHSLKSGWTITRCQICDSTDTAIVHSPASINKQLCKSRRSPFKTSMIVPLIAPAIAETPMLSNKALRQILGPYARDYSLTDNLLQSSRSEARKLIFGVPSENVEYAALLKEELEKKGHFVSLSFTNRRETIRNVEKIVLAEENQRRKDTNVDPLRPEERKLFVREWMSKNSDVLLAQLGSKDDDVQFLDGVLFAPSFSVKSVPYLQQTFMSDACHLNFGKYTLFSCYGVTANSNMSPVAFAILFGNENAANWTKFWDFAVRLHPTLDSEKITVITDQDKGQKSALSVHLPKCGHFHCTWHRRQNIMKMCGGGSGKTPYTALWMYNKLVACRNNGVIEHNKTMYAKFMSNKDLYYLNSLTDEEQYPGARCGMGDGIYMYQRTATSSVESMNAANREVRERTAVDPLNATLLLINLECKRFQRMKQQAWGDDSGLTPRGKELYESTYTDLSPAQFTFSQTECADYWEVQVQRTNVGTKSEQVQFPKEHTLGYTFGSYFGTCSCGQDKVDGIPCVHMAAVALSSRLRPQITPMSIMPYWWGREQWRRQFPDDVFADFPSSMKSIKDGKIPDPSYRYCPDWTAPNKSGRPKKNDRRKSGIEMAMENKKGDRKKSVKRIRCQICGKWNHETNDCFILTRHQKNNSVGEEQIEEALVEVIDLSETTPQQQECQVGTAD